MKKIFGIVVISVLVLLIASCNDDEITEDRSYLNEIEATYTGTLSMDNMKTSYPATANVAITENDQLQIHCYGELMDTTITMNAFQNGDSVMVCNTGQDFYNEYGNMGNGHHMMDQHMNESEWMHHLEDDHMEGDQHYGGFNMQNHSFSYSFKMMDGNTTYMLQFNGMKQ